MYKYLIIFIILIIFIFFYKVEEIPVFQTQTSNTITFCNNKENNYVLLELSEEKYLFLLEEKIKNVDLEDINYIITKDYYSFLLEKEDKVYVLNSSQKIGDLFVKEDGMISFNLENYNICLYSLDSSYSKKLSCDFLYLAKKNYNIYLNPDIKVLLYNKDITFNNRFLEQIYLNWIDIYPVNSCLKVEFRDDDFYIF